MPVTSITSDAREREAMGGLAHHPNGLIAQPQPQQPQVDHQHRSAQQHQAQQMDALDCRKQPQRVADGLADEQRLAPFEVGQQHDQETGHPAAQLTKAGWGWMSQSNQL